MFQLRDDHMSAFDCLAHDAMVERIAGAMYLLRPQTRAVRTDEFLAEVDRQTTYTAWPPALCRARHPSRRLARGVSSIRRP